MSAKRNYKSEYSHYQGRPSQIAKRSQRNSARRIEEKAGKNIKGMDVNHIKPIVFGGSNKPSNLNVKSPSANRSFARTTDAHMRRIERRESDKTEPPVSKMKLIV